MGEERGKISIRVIVRAYAGGIMDSVFVVQHSHVFPNGVEDTKTIGVYRTHSAAMFAVDRLSSQPGFAEHPNVIDASTSFEESGFYISEYQLDQDHWVEGFVTV